MGYSFSVSMMTLKPCENQQWLIMFRSIYHSRISDTRKASVTEDGVTRSLWPSSARRRPFVSPASGMGLNLWLYRVTDLDVVFKGTGNGGIFMLFATTRWCCYNRNYSAVLGCQVQEVKFDVLSKVSWRRWKGMVENFHKKCSLVYDLMKK